MSYSQPRHTDLLPVSDADIQCRLSVEDIDTFNRAIVAKFVGVRIIPE